MHKARFKIISIFSEQKIQTNHTISVVEHSLKA